MFVRTSAAISRAGPIKASSFCTIHVSSVSLSLRDRISPILVFTLSMPSRVALASLVFAALQLPSKVSADTVLVNLETQNAELAPDGFSRS